MPSYFRWIPQQNYLRHTIFMQCAFRFHTDIILGYASIIKIAGLGQNQWNHHNVSKNPCSGPVPSWAKVADPDSFFWMVFSETTKSIIELSISSSSHPISHSSQICHQGWMADKLLFVRSTSCPDKSVFTNNVERGNVFCLGILYMGCVQSLLLVSWDSLLFIHA